MAKQLSNCCLPNLTKIELGLDNFLCITKGEAKHGKAGPKQPLAEPAYINKYFQ